LYCSIEEISQTGDKLTKIRKLIPLYRNWQIYHKYGMEELEYQLERFPRGKHDDIIDALQMLYNMYELQPNNWIPTANIWIKRDINGNPIY
jgi:phage terminase large subunit-like protein